MFFQETLSGKIILSDICQQRFIHCVVVFNRELGSREINLSNTMKLIELIEVIYNNNNKAFIWFQNNTFYTYIYNKTNKIRTSQKEY